MGKLILRYGLISGAIVAALMFITFGLLPRGAKGSSFDYGSLIGFAGMIAAFVFSMMQGVKHLRATDEEFGYAKGMILCMGIAGITSLIYLLCWSFIYRFMYPDFMTDYAAWMENMIRTREKDPLEIKRQLDSVAKMKADYEKPGYFILATLTEIFPIGVVMSFLMPVFFLRRKS